MLRPVSVVAALILSATAAPAQGRAGQQPAIDNGAAIEREYHALGAALRPFSRPASRARLDSVADKLAAWTIAGLPAGVLVDRMIGIRTLVSAGARPASGLGGIPYDGAG